MIKREVAELLVFLSDSYPTFDVTQSRINTWTRLLKDQDYKQVMKNAEKYVTKHKFPPSVADIREVVSESRQKTFIDKVKQWESDAVGYKP